MKKFLKQNQSLILSICYPLAFGIFIFILWQTKALNVILGVDSFALPKPSRIVKIIFDNGSSIMMDLRVTLIVSIFGLILGSIFGYLIAILAALFPKVCKSGISVIAAFNSVPIVALSPVFINLSKLISEDIELRSMIAKIMVVTVISMSAMSFTAYRGLTETKPFSEDLLKSYACGKRTMLLKLRIPNSIPYIFTALKVSVPLSVISAIVSEYFTESTKGIGYKIKSNIALAQYSSGWAYIFVACLIGMLLYGVLIIIQGIILRSKHY